MGATETSLLRAESAAVPRGLREVRELFLRCLGLVFLCAFASLWRQLDGLWGSRGITPIAEVVAAGKAFLDPTLFATFSSDLALQIACLGGMLCGALLAIGILPLPALLAANALYLSFMNADAAGAGFLSFQWDTLLLEAGVLACFVAPPTLFVWHARAEPHPVAWFALRFLLFRLMLGSGAVKLLSGDPTWRDLSALEFHYWTQPLPPFVAHYAMDLPAWFHRASVAAMFAIELLLPPLIFGPRRARQVAAAGFALLQLSIIVTGNYGFFNLLTLVLCLPLLDDAALPRRWFDAPRPPPPPVTPPRKAARIAMGAVICGLMVLAAGEFAIGLGQRDLVPQPLLDLRAKVAPWNLVSRYGLFAVMTTDRVEIVMQCTADGREWKDYEFRDKPGATTARPRYCIPHLPRLDWMMWFAALGPFDQSRQWLLRFERRLLEAEPSVLALLQPAPLDGDRPLAVRAVAWRYRFSSASERDRGIWWKRERIGEFGPSVTLTAGELRAFGR